MARKEMDEIIQELRTFFDSIDLSEYSYEDLRKLQEFVSFRLDKLHCFISYGRIYASHRSTNRDG